MWYDKDHVRIYSSKDGYNLLSSDYQRFHGMLDKRDRQLWQRCLPRSLEWLDIVDIGAGDGRMCSWFADKCVWSYTAIDVAEDLLARCPSWVQKVVADAEEWLPCESWSVDIIVMLFVLLHIADIEALFGEIIRVLRPWGRCIVLHHLERRPYVHEVDGERFKIETWNHRFEELEQIAKTYDIWYEFFDVDEFTRLYCFEL